MSESYIPLYRKYRPQKFSDVVGQETVIKTLSNAVSLAKISHAYLFTGSRGTGKTSTARIMAKSLNCVEGPTINPCGKCPSCLDIANSNSIDVIEIDAASNRKVEDARNLLEKVHFMPVAGKYKVYIIDEVHMLTTEAFNTLLKTLEEPPKNLVFILATTESHKVLTTIISRCQRFDFKRVNQALISQTLKEIAQKENIKINDKAVSVISRRCNGGMRDALGLLDQISVLSSFGEEITEKDIISLLGSMPEDILFKISESIANKDTKNLISLINEISLTSEPIQIVRELITYFRNILFLKTSDSIEQVKELLDLSEGILSEAKVQSEKFETNEIVQIIEKLSDCERMLKTSSQQLLWLETGLIGICHRQDIQVLKDLEQRVCQLENILQSGNIPVAKQTLLMPALRPVEIPKQEPEPVAVAVTNPVKESNLQTETSSPSEPTFVENPSDNWKKLLENMDSVPARSFYSSLSKPVEVNSQKIVITFKTENFVKQAKDSGKIVPIEKAAEKLFGVLPKIIVRMPLPEDDLNKKKTDELTKPTFPQEKVQQISSSIVEEVAEATPKRGDSIVIDKEIVSEVEKELVEELNSVEPEIKPVNISEQAKLVLDLFNGKVIDSST